jgi:uncharacterized iron-regulated protein
MDGGPGVAAIYRKGTRAWVVSPGRISGAVRMRPRARLARAVLLLLGAVLVWGCSTRAVGPSPLEVYDGIDDHRIYATAAQRFVGFDAMAEQLHDADVVFFGEFHDDDVASRLQFDLLAEMLARHPIGTLGLEMFERDTQPWIDGYLRGEISEDTFLAESRPWTNYATGYRPLLEAARAAGWQVVATNLPQALATAIARDGLGALDAAPLRERELAAATIDCPQDDYWVRFVEAMTEAMAPDGGAHPTANAMLQNTYLAQCARDETMAESIAGISREGPVFHVNGSFHTDFDLGIVPRLRFRVPGLTIRTISAVPVDDLAGLDPQDHVERADFVIFTRAPAGSE